MTPYVAISALGLSYSLLASALWPIAALIIPEYQLGTAYGLMQVPIPVPCTFAQSRDSSQYNEFEPWESFGKICVAALEIPYVFSFSQFSRILGIPILTIGTGIF